MSIEALSGSCSTTRQSLGRSWLFSNSLPVVLLRHDVAFSRGLRIAALRQHVSVKRSDPRQSRGRVLIVDDDPDMVFISSAALEYAGYQVQVAADGLAALAAIRQERPDVVI